MIEDILERMRRNCTPTRDGWRTTYDRLMSEGCDEIERLRTREAKLVQTLEVYATESNWRMGGPLNPESPSFVGIGIAAEALQQKESTDAA